MTVFTFGADPEIFVRKNGKPLSAHGLVEGTKESPQKTAVGAVQVDGMALEFNIDPTPAHDFNQFNYNIVQTIADLRSLAGNVNLNIAPVQEFDADYMAAQPEEAKELGCDPDYNAYTLKPNPRPDGTRNYRTGAGHVHIGWGADIPVDNEEHMAICGNFVKMLDATVGMYMTFIDRDPRRRELYGAAGAFRPKPYGVEYRTPSNVWIKNKTRRYVMHGLLNLAVRQMQRGQSPVLGEAEVIQIINTGDHAVAAGVLDSILRYEGLLSTNWTAIKSEMAEEERKAAQVELPLVDA